MKRGATKEEIIRTTQELITRNGIRAVRVDEIAQTLGISKRTLYELFTDKSELVNACLDNMNRQLQERMASEHRNGSGNPLQRALQLMHEYIDSLFTVEQSFLADILRKVAYADLRDEHRTCWQNELVSRLSKCREHELLLSDIDTELFAGQMFDTLLELRHRNTKREIFYLFSRTILRGIATQKGIQSIDSQA